MLRATIHDNEPPITIGTTVELEQVLAAAGQESLARKILAGAILEAENGARLIVVVGGDETVVSFDSANGNPPYYVSRGSADNDDPVFTCFLSFAHYTEFSRRSVIPIADALEAANEFFRTAQLPRGIRWEEV